MTAGAPGTGVHKLAEINAVRDWSSKSVASAGQERTTLVPTRSMRRKGAVLLVGVTGRTVTLNARLVESTPLLLVPPLSRTVTAMKTVPVWAVAGVKTSDAVAAGLE